MSVNPHFKQAAVTWWYFKIFKDFCIPGGQKRVSIFDPYSIVIRVKYWHFFWPPATNRFIEKIQEKLSKKALKDLETNHRFSYMLLIFPQFFVIKWPKKSIFLATFLNAAQRPVWVGHPCFKAPLPTPPKTCIQTQIKS